MKVYAVCLSTTDHLDSHHVRYPVARPLINPLITLHTSTANHNTELAHAYTHTTNQCIKVAVKIPIFLPGTYIFVFILHGYSNGLLCLFSFHYEL